MKRITTALALALVLSVTLVAVADAATFVLQPDGSGDFATIQDAVDGAAPGDTILLADGTFVGAGNRDVDFGGKALTIRSQSGIADNCIIDCDGAGRAFVFLSGEDASSVVEAVTLTGGVEGSGGAIYFQGIGSPQILGCKFQDNVASAGAAIFMTSGSTPSLVGCQFIENDSNSTGIVYCASATAPLIEDCEFIGNTAPICAGVYASGNTAPTIRDCLFLGNVADFNAALYVRNGSSAVVEGSTFVENVITDAGDVLLFLTDGTAVIDRCTIARNQMLDIPVIGIGSECDATLTNTIIAHNTQGTAVVCLGTVTAACNNIFGNGGGDYTWCLDGELGMNGNISAEPIFCAPSGDYTLAENSPCAPEANESCGLIGAHPVACDAASTLALEPERITTYYPCGGSIPIDLNSVLGSELGGFELCVGYDDSDLSFSGFTLDDTFLESSGRSFSPTLSVPCASECEIAGRTIGATSSGGVPGPIGEGRLATIFLDRNNEDSEFGQICLSGWMFEGTTVPPQPIPIALSSGVDLTHRGFCFGDFNDDGDVSVVDVMQVASRWGLEEGASLYSEVYDVNPIAAGNYCASLADGIIDVVDVQSVASRWGLGCLDPGPQPLESGEMSERGQATLRFEPKSLEWVGEEGETAEIVLHVDDASSLGAFQAEVSFDPEVLEVVSIVDGGFLEDGGRTAFSFEPVIDNEAGIVRFGSWTIGDGAGAEGTGVLAEISVAFRGCPGRTQLQVSEAVLTNPEGWPLGAEDQAGMLVVTECRTPASAPSALPTEFRLFPSRPNPSGDLTRLSFAIPEIPGRQIAVELTIVDAAGRVVRRFQKAHTSGVHEVVWDGRDAEGAMAPSGAYFARLRAADQVFQTRIIRID